MRAFPVLFAFVVVGLTAASALAKPETLKVIDTYTGTVANDKKPELKTGFVAAEGEWKDVWTKLSKEKLPEVDFGKHFLLVSTQDAADPNRRGPSVVKDDKGVVQLVEISTLIGFEPSDKTIYRFYKVSREGVTGVKRYDAKTGKAVVDPLPK